MNRSGLFAHTRGALFRAFGALRCAFVGIALIVGASSAAAQVSGPPSIMQPKEAAQRAASRTNAHTNAMQAPQDAPAPSRATTPARTTAASSAQQGTRPAVPKPGNARTAAATSGPSDTTRAIASTSISKRGGRGQISLSREVYAYEASGRRDPFLSLIMSGELRPMISDLKLVTVIYDATGRSVAILRDVTSKQQYRVKVGQELGRMRVASIQPKSVTFTLDEFGFNRQEVLALGDPLKERTQ